MFSSLPDSASTIRNQYEISVAITIHWYVHGMMFVTHVFTPFVVVLPTSPHVPVSRAFLNCSVVSNIGVLNDLRSCSLRVGTVVRESNRGDDFLRRCCCCRRQFALLNFVMNFGDENILTLLLEHVVLADFCTDGFLFDHSDNGTWIPSFFGDDVIDRLGARGLGRACEEVWNLVLHEKDTIASVVGEYFGLLVAA